MIAKKNRFCFFFDSLLLCLFFLTFQFGTLCQQERFSLLALRALDMDAAEARSLLETTRLLSEQLHAEPHLPTPPTTSSTTSSTTSTNSSSAPSSGLALDSSLLAELSNSLCSFLPSAKMNPKGLLNPVVDPPPVSPPAASAPFLPRAVPQAAPVLAPTTRPLSPALSTPSVPLAPPTLLHSPRTPLPTLLPTPVGLGLFPLPRPLPLPSLAFAVSADRSVTMSRDADTRVLSFHCKEISTHLGQLIHPPGSECWHAAGNPLFFCALLFLLDFPLRKLCFCRDHPYRL